MGNFDLFFFLGDCNKLEVVVFLDEEEILFCSKFFCWELKLGIVVLVEIEKKNFNNMIKNL